MNHSTNASQTALHQDLPGMPFQSFDTHRNSVYNRRFFGALASFFIVSLLVVVSVLISYKFDGFQNTNENTKLKFDLDNHVAMMPEETQNALVAPTPSEAFIDNNTSISTTYQISASKDKQSRLNAVVDKLSKMSLLEDKEAGDTVVTPPPSRLMIADGPEHTSGFFREVPGVDDEHFLVVNSVDDNGNPVFSTIVDMDTGIEHHVSSWAVLVPMEEFVRFSSEKSTIGTFSNPEIGQYIDGNFNWLIDTDEKYLVNWQEFAE